MLPISRKAWEEMTHLCHGWWEPDTATATAHQHLHSCIPANEAIRRSAQWLIERLYEPTAENEAGYWVTGRYWAMIGAIEALDAYRKEAINWGDLNVVDVSQKVYESGEIVWLVTLEEASEGQCPALCAYIRGWLVRWGWGPVEVITTW